MITILRWTRIAHTIRPAHRQTEASIGRSIHFRGASLSLITLRRVLLCPVFFAALSFSSCVSSLTFAVGDGDVDEVKRLVEDERVDINEGGGAPLQMAVIEGSFEIFSYLIDKGANVRARDDYGWTVFLLAARQGRVDMLKLLLDRGADINDRARDDYGWTAFLLAARQGRVDMLKLLLDRGADINDRMKYWRKADSSTALIIAARYARDEAVYFLKAHGLSISNEKAVFMVGFEMRKQEDFWPKGDVILKTIDGKDMEGYGLLELEPGIHTAVLMYLSEIKEMDFKRTTTGFMSRVSIVAEQGHIYVVHANLSEDSWMPVVRDYSIR